MRRYGSAKRNPNPPWPGVQSSVVLPPGTNEAAIGRFDMAANNDDIIRISEREAEEVQERNDRLTPIMDYMEEGGMSMNNSKTRSCTNMSVTEYLCDKTGSYARVEFMFGENTHIEKTGMLENVGKDFVVLTEAGTGSRIVCSSKNIKFINIYNIK